MGVDADRPTLRALVGYFVLPFGIVGQPKLVPLDLALEYHRLGFTVLVDPADEVDLATWERQQRWTKRIWNP